MLGEHNAIETQNVGLEGAPRAEANKGLRRRAGADLTFTELHADRAYLNAFRAGHNPSSTPLIRDFFGSWSARRTFWPARSRLG